MCIGDDQMLADTHSPPQQHEKPAGALLTRHEAAEFVTKVLGRPLSFSTLQKLCCLGEGPPVETQWGRRPLYSREGLSRRRDRRRRDGALVRGWQAHVVRDAAPWLGAGAATRRARHHRRHANMRERGGRQWISLG